MLSRLFRYLFDAARHAATFFIIAAAMIFDDTLLRFASFTRYADAAADIMPMPLSMPLMLMLIRHAITTTPIFMSLPRRLVSNTSTYTRRL